MSGRMVTFKFIVYINISSVPKGFKLLPTDNISKPIVVYTAPLFDTPCRRCLFIYIMDGRDHCDLRVLNAQSNASANNFQIMTSFKIFPVQQL